MSGKKQLSILSFALRGKPTKKARLRGCWPREGGEIRGGDRGGDGLDGRGREYIIYIWLNYQCQIFSSASLSNY